MLKYTGIFGLIFLLLSYLFLVIFGVIEFLIVNLIATFFLLIYSIYIDNLIFIIVNGFIFVALCIKLFLIISNDYS